MSYWLVRDLEGNAVGVDDETPETGIVEDNCGVWIADVRFNDGRYEYYLVDRTTKTESGEHTNAFVLMGAIHPITKDQYETYQAFGLFSDE
jgi:hypothetical protein